MGPVAEAEWEIDTELLASCSSTSMRFLFPRVVRTLRLLDEARVTVTRDEGLGDSFNLDREKSRLRPGTKKRNPKEAEKTSPFFSSLQELAVSVNLHVQGQIDIQQLFILIKMLLHLSTDFSHLEVFVCQHPATVGLLLHQLLLQARYAVTPATSLRAEEQLWAAGHGEVTGGSNPSAPHKTPFTKNKNKNKPTTTFSPTILQKALTSPGAVHQ